jgi:hypothetical protein
VLQAFDAVGHQQGDRAEHQHRQGILLPVLLLLRINAAKLVEQTLDPSEEARERLPVSLKYTMHVPAERLGYRENYRRKEQNLNPPIYRHDISRLRTNAVFFSLFRIAVNFLP